MEKVYRFLSEKGYSNINTLYYTYIDNWLRIWKGKAKWLKLKTTSNSTYLMYSLGMGKKVCEDFASIITSEPFEIKATKNNDLMHKLLKEAKVLEKLPQNLELMACTGTVGTVARIVDASLKKVGNDYVLERNPKTKIKTVDVSARQVIPLTVEDGEIINCAFVSTHTRKIGNQLYKVYYLEVHELKEKGYQITNKYFSDETDLNVTPNNVIETYNTLSQIPLFSINKMIKVNPIENNNGLGFSLIGNALDQLMLVDLTYNNFGSDFRLGQKLLIINKNLVRKETEDYTDENGNLKTRTKLIYPSDLRKQQFLEIGEDISSIQSDKVYIHEYNPDLRVGANVEGIQFALDTLSFKIDFGTRYYSFKEGNLTTATEAILSNKDLVNNARKNRYGTNNYLIGVCRALLLCEKMLGNTTVDIDQEIEIKDVDGFLEDDESKREKARQDVINGLKSKKRYLVEIENMTEEEAEKELEQISSEDEINSINMGE